MRLVQVASCQIHNVRSSLVLEEPGPGCVVVTRACLGFLTLAGSRISRPHQGCTRFVAFPYLTVSSYLQSPDGAHGCHQKAVELPMRILAIRKQQGRCLARPHMLSKNPGIRRHLVLAPLPRLVLPSAVRIGQRDFLDSITSSRMLCCASVPYLNRH